MLLVQLSPSQVRLPRVPAWSIMGAMSRGSRGSVKTVLRWVPEVAVSHTYKQRRNTYNTEDFNLGS